MAASKKVITIRLTEELSDALKAKADEESTTVTELITRFVRDGLSDKQDIIEKVDALQGQLEVLESGLKEAVDKAVEKVQGGLTKVEGQAELLAKIVIGSQSPPPTSAST
jgi:uncharacterized protein (DUF2342 family)